MSEKEITIYDLATKLNISAATVSRGLKDHPGINKATKKKIFDLAKEMGYRSNNFASNLRRKSTNTIGVIVPRLNSNFMSTVLAGIENVANQQGYNLIISQSLESHNKEITNAETMFNNRVDGLLVSLAYDTDNIDHFEPFVKTKTPVLFFDRVAENKNFVNIIVDNKQAAFEATTHLIRQGCKRIAHVTAIPKRNVYVDRLSGYKEALLCHGLPYIEDLVIVGNLSMEAGFSAAKKLMSLEEKPDGVFVSNDNCAVACMQAFKAAGFRIPEDISFVGFNNDPVSTVIEPNLTTIDYPGYKMGEIAAQTLIDHLKSKSTSTMTNTIILRSELIPRASSKRK